MNDHLGGALMVNPKSENRYASRVAEFIAEMNICMDPEEALVLLENIEGFAARMDTINRNALAVARYLESHRSVGKVYYPFLESHPDYLLAQRYLSNGGSGIVSFSLAKSNLERARRFYDNCTLPGKGPSLGSEETLLCPITLLTYFKSSDDELAAMGLDRYLMRLSVGVEDANLLISQIEAGLSAVD
jgi:cystathionine beta-lyase/cystathionine gamma-synthase